MVTLATIARRHREHCPTATVYALSVCGGESLAVYVERSGHAAERIVRIAKETDADLIVLGHKGHFLRDHLLGSTADRVAEHANCPVMIVK
jgi:nucleotide-binding universal stress UspA family protein